MPSPTIRFWKKKLLLLKLETTYGVDPTPTGANNYVEARNVAITPYEADVADRQLVRQSMGNTSKLITGRRVKLSFDVALAASGVAGTAPKIAPVLRACGWAENITAGVSVAYTLCSSGFESAAFSLNIDGVWHKGLGCRGTATPKLDKGIPLLHVELTALYVAPTDSPAGSATRTGWPIEAPVNSRNTLVCKVNNVDSYYDKFSLAQNNQVVHDDFPGGYEAISIKDRAPTSGISIIAPLLATLDPFALADAATNIPIQVVHGATAGNKVQIDEKALITGVAYEELNGTTGYALTLSLEDPDDADGEAVITFK